MSDTNIQAVIEKVKKLLQLSKSTSANEAAVASSIANKLIDEYRLSVADFADTVADEIVKDDSYLYETGRVIPWKAQLASQLAHFYGCSIVIEHTYPSNRKTSHYKMIGRKADIDICRYMFSWLLSECNRLANKEAKGKGHVFVFSYCFGFVNGVMEQLKLSRKAAEVSATSTAIVKIDSRYQESKAAMEKMYKNLTFDKNSSKSHIDNEAFKQGQVKGKQTHLGSALKDKN